MIRIHAQVRESHQYANKPSHKDVWDSEVFTFKMLTGKRVRESSCYSDGGSWLYRVIGSKKLNQKKQALALRHTLSVGNCQHEHDCCGCRSQAVSVRRIKKGIFSVIITVSYNY